MPPTARITSAIGRYQIERVLRERAQGASYLARDTRLDRTVLIKTLASGAEITGGLHTTATLLQAARQVSGLAHPNIATLFDTGEDAGTAYVVWEFVEGRTLESLMAERATFPLDEALGIGIQLCKGLAYAHERNIVHGAVGASTVMVTPEGVPRLLEFGIPFAAEPAAGAAPSADADVRAVARLVYRLLAGREAPAPAQTGDGPAIAADAIDARLALVFGEALSDTVPNALTTAAALGEAFAEALEPAPADPAVAGSQATLDYLLRRIRLKGEFPALSATISAVNRAAASDREPVGVLCNSILKDIALTGRLLKIVNGSHLNQFGGSISTVSRAVAILGYDAVRNVTMSLALFEHMHDRANAVALKDQIVGIYFSGLLAREFAASAGLQDLEEAFICAMFHRLGKLLATFYLHDEALLVQRHVQGRDWTEERASREVLGLSYEDLGIGVGRAWNLPDEIVESMRGFTGHARKRPDQDVEKLRMLAGLANELADVVQNADEGKRKEELAQLVRRYGPAMGVSDRGLVAAVEASAKVLIRDAESLSHGVARSPFLRSAGSWLLRPERVAPVVEPGVPDASGVAPATQQLVAAARLDADATAAPSGRTEQARRQADLTAGIQEITNTLVGDHTLNDVLRIILETMYRAIGFQRVLLFSLDPREKSLRCRFGFGADTDVIVQKRVSVPLHGKRDLFYAAVVMGADLCIDDLESEKIRAHVPPWYKAAIGARGIVLLPIVNRQRTLGLIYADSDSPEVLRFGAEELSLLKTMRNQALLAMRQSL
jgi:HD-like signal output (HDOD) protein